MANVRVDQPIVDPSSGQLVGYRTVECDEEIATTIASRPITPGDVSLMTLQEAGQGAKTEDATEDKTREKLATDGATVEQDELDALAAEDVTETADPTVNANPPSEDTVVSVSSSRRDRDKK